MTLSYHLGCVETIFVHPTRRQNYAGKLHSTFYNIWDLVNAWILSSEKILQVVQIGRNPKESIFSQAKVKYSVLAQTSTV